MLELSDIRAGYADVQILNGVDLALRKATITTVIGPNGAGKSTLFKAIFGLIRVRSGRIRFGDADITNERPARLLARGIAYVPQGRNVVPRLSVWHNLELGAVTQPEQSDVGARIETVMDRFPALRQHQARKAGDLSGGQQKQLEIARALLLEPRLLLIDEPSIGLSPNLVREVFTVLQGLRDAGVTVLMVEQNAKAALAISDDGLVLELGRVRMHAPAAQLLADPAVGRLFLGAPIEG